MRFLVCGDWHITDKKPARRLDENYLDTCLGKVEQLLRYAKDNKIKYLLQAGDFFDSHRASDNVLQRTIALLLKYPEVSVYAIYGQHDQRFHSSEIDNTPLKVLSSAKVVTIPFDSNGLFIVIPEDKPVYVYGASWYEEVPKILVPEATNILITHRMIIQDKLWEAQEDFTFSKNMFRQYKFDYFVTGDNHQCFTAKVAPRGGDTRYLMNCGSLLRTTITQAAHTPCAYVLDTVKNSITQHLLPVADFADVMDIAAAEEEKQLDADMQEFIDSLQQHTLDDIPADNFINALHVAAETCSPAVRQEISSILNNVPSERSAA